MNITLEIISNTRDILSLSKIANTCEGIFDSFYLNKNKINIYEIQELDYINSLNIDTEDLRFRIDIPACDIDEKIKEIIKLLYDLYIDEYVINIRIKNLKLSRSFSLYYFNYEHTEQKVFNEIRELLKGSSVEI